MAATFAFRSATGFNAPKVPGQFFEALIQVTGDSSYPAGGYPFGTAQLQALTGGANNTIEHVIVANPWVSSTPTSFTAVWNNATGKIMAQAQAVAGAANSLVDVTATTNLSTFTCSLLVRFF